MGRRKKDGFEDWANALPPDWNPKFLEQSDKRRTIVKRIRERMGDLTLDVVASPAELSYRQRSIIQRAAFQEAQIEILEMRFIDPETHGAITNDDLGRWAVLSNSLMAIYKRMEEFPQRKEQKDIGHSAWLEGGDPQRKAG
jgi:hypothetical protein